MLNFVFPPWARVALMLLVFGAGYWTRGSIEARKEVHELKYQVKQADKVDETVADKLRNEARADAQLSAAQRKNQDAAKHDPSYNDYLDSPLPKQSLEFLRDAEAVDPSPDGAKARVRPDRSSD
ncbi:MAG TPA: hypothetical protein VIQ76_15980 [Propionibacteriaceae bacterium]|jgi:hypothetical protein